MSPDAAATIAAVIVDHGRPRDAAAAAESCVREGIGSLVVVDDACGAPAPHGVVSLRQPSRRGWGAGANLGIGWAREHGIGCVLLLNNDATLEPGAVAPLRAALAEPARGAVAPLVVRAGDGRLESRGARFDLGSGRYRLLGHGEWPGAEAGVAEADSLSGCALLVRVAAFDAVGGFDEAYFHGFEDADWCVRARRAGWTLAVATGARVRHAGAATLGRSPARLYYAVRNHLRAVEKLEPLSGAACWRRRAGVVAINLAHAVRQGEVPRLAGVAAVARGVADFAAGRSGPGEVAA